MSSAQRHSQRHFQPEHLVAGVSGGLLSVLMTHPLELVKVRFQVDDFKKSSKSVQQPWYRPSYKGVTDAFSTIYREGGVRGLYGGVTPNLIGAGSAWGLYFLVFNGLKSRQIEKDAGQTLTSGRDLTLGEHFVLAGQTGLVTLTLTNPIWVAKTRLCLQYEKNLSASTSSSTPKVKPSNSHKGMGEVLLHLWKSEGLKGLYRGYLPVIVGISHGVVQFVSYEELKKHHCRSIGVAPNSKLGTKEYLLFSSISKLLAAGLTYPYQVVRSRLQEQHRRYRGVNDVILSISRTEGMSGFYKGLLPCLLRVVPATAITFVTYENVIRLLA